MRPSARRASACFGLPAIAVRSCASAPSRSALQTEGEAEVVGVRGIAAGEARGLPQLGDRFVQALPLGQELPEDQAPSRPLGVHRDRGAQRALGLFQVGGLAQAAAGTVTVPEMEAEIVLRFAAAGRARGHLAQELDGAVEIALLREDHAQAVAGVHGIGIEAPGGLEGGDRLRAAPEAIEDRAQVEVELAPPGIETDRFTGGRQRRLRLTRLAEGHAEAVLGGGIRGVGGHCRPQLGQGGGDVALLEQREAAIAMGRRSLRLREREAQEEGAHYCSAGGLRGAVVPSLTIRTTARRSSAPSSSPRSCALSALTRDNRACARAVSPFLR